MGFLIVRILRTTLPNPEAKCISNVILLHLKKYCEIYENAIMPINATIQNLLTFNHNL